jgi:hypothetical protein
MSDDQIEHAAAVLAKLLPSAIDIHFNGEACTAKWPHDFGPHEQAAFRLIARTMFSVPVGSQQLQENADD